MLFLQKMAAANSPMKVKEESWTCQVKRGQRNVSRIMGRLKSGIAFTSYLSDGDISVTVDTNNGAIPSFSVFSF